MAPASDTYRSRASLKSRPSFSSHIKGISDDAISLKLSEFEAWVTNQFGPAVTLFDGLSLKHFK